MRLWDSWPAVHGVRCQPCMAYPIDTGSLGPWPFANMTHGQQCKCHVHAHAPQPKRVHWQGMGVIARPPPVRAPYLIATLGAIWRRFLPGQHTRGCSSGAPILPALRPVDIHCPLPG